MVVSSPTGPTGLIFINQRILSLYGNYRFMDLYACCPCGYDRQICVYGSSGHDAY
ncbi:hypothetical protein BC941DRAFT_409159 [Chlamydoabsidia padenii]|nr:hypothetical protein BC941DRAFT_409159 [Chlamydoabsidia padenii]